MRIPHDAYVLVCDGRKALFLKNAGDATMPNFKTTRVLTNGQNQPTHELGTDRPGRAFNSSDARRSGMEQTDFHDLEEQNFARDVMAELDRFSQTEKIGKLVLVAPPRTLSVLRSNVPTHLKQSIMGEVDKDLTRHPVYEIEKILAD